jgi:hypothetical protein
MTVVVTNKDGSKEEIFCKPSGLVFEDPLYEKPILNVPIKWISLRGELKISTEVEDGEYVVSITTFDLKSNKIRIGFTEFTDMTTFVASLESSSVIEQENGGFVVNPQTYKHPAKESFMSKSIELLKEKLKLARMAFGVYG